MFNARYKDADLRDNPRRSGFHLRNFEKIEHIHEISQPEMIPALQDIRKIWMNIQNVMVGETFLADSAQARTYVGDDRLHAAFDYGYANSPFSARAFGKAIQYWDGLHGEDAWPNYFLNNHDILILQPLCRTQRGCQIKVVGNHASDRAGNALPLLR